MILNKLKVASIRQEQVGACCLHITVLRVIIQQIPKYLLSIVRENIPSLTFYLTVVIQRRG
jgi:hypothetical protein